MYLAFDSMFGVLPNVETYSPRSMRHILHVLSLQHSHLDIREVYIYDLSDSDWLYTGTQVVLR